jgi:hypothetical protein
MPLRGCTASIAADLKFFSLSPEDRRHQLTPQSAGTGYAHLTWWQIEMSADEENRRNGNKESIISTFEFVFRDPDEMISGGR